MKKSNVIAGAAFAVAGIVTYFLRRKMRHRSVGTLSPGGKHGRRHVTYVFARAKDKAR
jgi:hypothetical protein